MKKIETIIIIPNYNGINHLKECLDSLLSQSYKSFRIIIIDDASTDESVSFIKENYPKIDIFVNKENLGFAKSTNLGIIKAIEKYTPNYIALLNNDTKADKNWLKYLVKAIESEDKIAAVASNIKSYDDTKIIDNQGLKISLKGTGEPINFGRKEKEIKKIQKNIIASSFGATLIKTRFLGEIGLIDERYSAYCEDLDWGLRANILGYKIIFEEKAIIYHKRGGSYGRNSLKPVYFCRRNQLCTIIKNYEAKNLRRALISIFADYIHFSMAQLINLTIKKGKLIRIQKGVSFKERILLSFIPFRSIIWNVLNLGETLRLRRQIQKKRKVKDEAVIKLTNPQ